MDQPSFWTRLSAYLTHLLTASGAALGFLALIDAAGGRLARSFLWLGVALVVDAVDGPIARHLRVGVNAPRYDGAVLDLVVDFVTYVLALAAMIVWGELIPGSPGVAAALAIVAGSALYFADTRMKTADLWFQGFPAVWNVVALYLAVFPLPAWVGFAVVAAAVAAMFLPAPFVHPMRVARLRPLTLAMLTVWTLAAVLSVASDFAPGWPAKAALLATAIYFLGLGIMRRPRA